MTSQTLMRSAPAKESGVAMLVTCRLARPPAQFDGHVFGGRVVYRIVSSRLGRQDGGLAVDVAEGDRLATSDVEPVAHRGEDTATPLHRVRRAIDRHDDVACRERQHHSLGVAKVDRAITVDDVESAVVPAGLLRRDGHGAMGIGQCAVRSVPARTHSPPPWTRGAMLMNHHRGRCVRRSRRCPPRLRRAGRAGRDRG